MVKLLLKLKAQLSNVASISVAEDHQYCLTVKDSTSEETREGVFISAEEEHELAGSRGTANFVLKFDKQSKKQCYINVMEVKNVTRAYTSEDSGSWVPLICFEGRGMEPTKFHPKGGFRVTASSGKVFDDVDLSEGEWFEYDDDAGESVEITEFESTFEVFRD